jgi:hypothetical protein
MAGLAAMGLIFSAVGGKKPVRRGAAEGVGGFVALAIPPHQGAYDWYHYQAGGNAEERCISGFIRHS